MIFNKKLSIFLAKTVSLILISSIDLFIFLQRSLNKQIALTIGLIPIQEKQNVLVKTQVRVLV